MTLQIHTLTRAGVRLAYAQGGSGEATLLFIHGNACDHTFLAPQAHHFAGSYRVLAPDLRGHGLSDKPPGDYSFEGYAEDCAWLCDRLDTGPTVVIGHSLGGMVGLAFAARYPERVKGLVILDSSLMADTHRQKVFLPSILEGLEGPAYLEAAHRFFGPLFGPRFPLKERERIMDLIALTPQHVLVANCRELIRWDGTECLRGLSCPCLYVAGGDGWRHQPAELKAVLPGILTAQVALGGHFLPLENPDQVTLMLERFLREALGE